jgi:hypothetical protein
VRTLDRNRIDAVVRELETGAYRLALALVIEPASAERIVLAAFATLASSLAVTPQTIELREKLYTRIRQRASRETRAPVVTDDRSELAAVVTESLHLRIVDLLEEEQAVEPVGRRRAVLLGLIGAVLVGALIAVVWVRSDALAAAQPTVADLTPAAGAKEVPLHGDFKVSFGRRPVGIPTLRLEPAQGTLQSARWDGDTLVVSYEGLHLDGRYQLILAANYRSRFKDLGHYEKRWTFTTEGYPVLVAFGPPEGQTLVTRVGQMCVDFNHRPPVEPRLSIVPADGTMLPGQWSGTTWTISYTGLMPLTRYQATVVVDYGVAAANIRRQWAFSTEPGAPPTGVPVIWYSTSNPRTSPADPQRLLAVDWNGKLAGTMYLVGTAYQASAVPQQAPDGSVLVTQDGGYLDGNGMRSGARSGYPYVPMIADDSRRVCNLGDPGGSVGGGQLWLFTGPLGGPLRRVGPVGSAGARSGLGIIACSVANDRAVVTDTGMSGTTSVRVIALSTGRVVYQRSYAAFGPSVLSSHDGRYLAELSATYDAQGQPLGAVTVIRRTADGKVMTRMDNRRIVQFSWDGLRVVTAPIYPAQGHNEVDLVAWQDGKVLWRQVGGPGTNGSQPAYAMPQPNGPGMVIAVGSQPSSGDVDQLWLVAADGQATQVVSGVFYPAFIGGF